MATGRLRFRSGGARLRGMSPPSRLLPPPCLCGASHKQKLGCSCWHTAPRSAKTRRVALCRATRCSRCLLSGRLTAVTTKRPAGRRLTDPTRSACKDERSRASRPRARHPNRSTKPLRPLLTRHVVRPESSLQKAQTSATRQGAYAQDPVALVFRTTDPCNISNGTGDSRDAAYRIKDEKSQRSAGERRFESPRAECASRSFAAKER